MKMLMKKTRWVALAVAVGSCVMAQGADGLESGFMNPPAQARPHTWWHWMNGNITREGITRDLEAIAEMGLGGVNLFNVSCDIPAGPVDYMSPEWLDLVRHAAAEAKRLKLEMGIQNCAGWATSGGPWIQPEDNMMKLVHTLTRVEGGRKLSLKLEQPETQLDYYRDVAILAYPATPVLKETYNWRPSSKQVTCRSGKQPQFADYQNFRPLADDPGLPADQVIELTSKLGADGTLEWEAPAGEWTILRLGYTPSKNTNHPAPASGRGLEINKLKRRGADVHWKHGIQPILDHLGDLAPGVLNNLVIDSYEARYDNWSPDMPAEFLKRRGYDMTPYLPAMVGVPVGSVHRTERFYWDYRRTVSELIAENFYGYMTELSHKHGLICSVEPYRGPFESMAVASKPDVPMAEFFTGLDYGKAFLKMVSSAAHLYDRPVAAAESFTCGIGKAGWRNHPATLRSDGDFAWTEGINRFVFHRYAHQPWDDKFPGMTMGPYGFHFERSNTWWEPGRAWIDYIARSQFLLQQGELVADLLCFAGEASPNTRWETDDLKAAGYDQHFCGTDMIFDLKTVGGDIVTPTGKRYRMLALPPELPFMTLELAKAIEELVRNGGAVWGRKPTHSPSLSGFPASERQMREIAQKVWGDCDGKEVTSHRYGKGVVFWGLTPVEAMAQLKVRPDVRQTGEPQLLHWIHRRTGKEDIYLVSNQSLEYVKCELGLRVAGRMPEFWDAETATIRPVAGWRVDGEHLSVPVALAPKKSIFVVFRGKPVGTADPVIKVEFPGETNKLTIVEARFESLSGKEDPRSDVTEKLRGYMKDGRLDMNVGNNCVTPFFGFYVGDPHKLTVTYEWKGRTSTRVYPLNAQVTLPHYRDSDEYWTPGFDTADGTRLRAWRNGEYTLHRATGKTDKIVVAGLAEPVELGGPWEVTFQPGRGAPEKARFDTLIPWNEHDDEGIRYFSGTATCTTRFEVPASLLAKDTQVWLDLGEVGVMARVRLNGADLGVLWMEPYRVDVSGALKAGRNTLEIDVTNLWINRLIGDEQHPDDCAWSEKDHLTEWPEWLLSGKPRPVKERLTFTTWKHWKKDDQLFRSGLIGPVLLKPARLLEVDAAP